MKTIATAAALVLSSLCISTPTPGVSAFSPAVPINSSPKASQTHLKYTVVGPPPDEDCDIDGSDCEESIFDRKRREKAEAETAIREKYVEGGLDLNEIDMMETPDMYSNPTGGGLIPGVHLSALMEDD